jgi:hypothetical protein
MSSDHFYNTLGQLFVMDPASITFPLCGNSDTEWFIDFANDSWVLRDRDLFDNGGSGYWQWQTSTEGSFWVSIGHDIRPTLVTAGGPIPLYFGARIITSSPVSLWEQAVAWRNPNNQSWEWYPSNPAYLGRQTGIPIPIS